MKKGRGLEWHKEKSGFRNTETRWGGRGKRDAESRRKLRAVHLFKKMLLMEKWSKSWPCSYWFFSLLLIPPSFTFPFWRHMGHNPSVYACQVSGHVLGYDTVRIFWTEELITLIYITQTFTFSVTNMSPRLFPSPDAHHINLAISTCFHPFFVTNDGYLNPFHTNMGG